MYQQYNTESRLKGAAGSGKAGKTRYDFRQGSLNSSNNAPPKRLQTAQREQMNLTEIFRRQKQNYHTLQEIQSVRSERTLERESNKTFDSNFQFLAEPHEKVKGQIQLKATNVIQAAKA